MTHKPIHTLLGFMLLIVLASPTMASTNTPSIELEDLANSHAIVEIRQFFLKREWFRIGPNAYKFEYRHDLHDFGPKWGPLQGVRPYLEVNRYETRFDRATRLDPKTGRPTSKEFIIGEYIYPWKRTPYGDKMPYFEQFRIPWGRRDNLGKRPGRHVLDPSDFWVALVAKEIRIREEWIRLHGWKHIGPTSTDIPYQGPLPSPHLIDLIFGIVAGASW